MTKFVFDFTEGDKDQKDLLGGKGANLAEMTKLGCRCRLGSPSRRRLAGSTCRGAASPVSCECRYDGIAAVGGSVDGSVIAMIRCW